MSRDYYILDFICPIADATGWINDLTSAQGKAEELPAGDRQLSASRNGWLLECLDHMADDWDCPFLHSLKGDSAVFQGVELNRAVAGIDRLLGSAAANPGEFSRYLDGEWSAGRVLDHWCKASATEVVPGASVFSENGNDPFYLFMYLRTMRRLLVRAQAEAKAFVHLRPDW